MNDRTCPSTLTCGSLIHPKHLATARCLLGVQPLPLLPTFITFLGNSSSSTHGQCTLSHSPTCAAAALLPWRHPCPLTRNPDQRNDHHHPCTQLTPASVSIHDSPPFVTAIMQYTCRHREPWFSKVYASRCCSPVPLPRPWRRPSPEPRLPSVQPPRAAPPPAHAAVRPRPRAHSRDCSCCRRPSRDASACGYGHTHSARSTQQVQVFCHLWFVAVHTTHSALFHQHES